MLCKCEEIIFHTCIAYILLAIGSHCSFPCLNIKCFWIIIFFKNLMLLPRGWIVLGTTELLILRKSCSSIVNGFWCGCYQRSCSIRLSWRGSLETTPRECLPRVIVAVWSRRIWGNLDKDYYKGAKNNFKKKLSLTEQNVVMLCYSVRMWSNKCKYLN